MEALLLPAMPARNVFGRFLNLFHSKYFWLFLLSIFALVLVTFPYFIPAMGEAEAPKVYHFNAPYSSSYYRSEFVETPEGMELRELRYAGGVRSYYMYAPGGEVSVSRPVVVLLHDSGYSGASMIEQWRSLADQKGIILVAPNMGKGNTSWRDSDNSMTYLRTMMVDVNSQHNVNSQQLFLFGHSAGAVQAIRLAMEGAMPFKAIALHAGSYPYPILFGFIQQYFFTDTSVPITMMVGSDDNMFSVDTVFHTAYMLQRGGFDVLMYVIDGHTHWYYDIAPIINANAWHAFMRAL